MAAPSKITPDQWADVVAARAKRPPTSWRALAAQIGISHVSLIERWKRHEAEQAEARKAERAAKAAVDPRRPETALPAPRPERKPGEPIPVGGYRDPRTLEYEESTEAFMHAQGRSGYVARTVVVEAPRYKGNLRDDTEARALARAEQLRAQREADAEDFADGRFDPSGGRWMP